MKAFFKDSDKIIINSMDYTEALVGKQFLKDLEGKVLVAEQRNDINDDFDGLVLTVGLAPTAGDLTVTPTTEAQEIEAPEGLGFARVFVNPVTSAIDANIVPENIVKGVSILGVEGNASLELEGSGSFYTVSGATGDPTTLMEAPGVENWALWLQGANEFSTYTVLLRSDDYFLNLTVEAASENSATVISQDGIAYAVEITTDPETGDKQLVVTPDN